MDTNDRDGKIPENSKLRRLKIISLPAIGGARGDQGSEALRYANLFIFPLSWFLIFQNSFLIRGASYPLSSFLFPFSR